MRVPDASYLLGRSERARADHRPGAAALVVGMEDEIPGEGSSRRRDFRPGP